MLCRMLCGATKWLLSWLTNFLALFLHTLGQKYFTDLPVPGSFFYHNCFLSLPTCTVFKSSWEKKLGRLLVGWMELQIESLTMIHFLCLNRENQIYEKFLKGNLQSSCK